MSTYTPRDEADAARVARVLSMGNLVLSNGNGFRVGVWGPRADRTKRGESSKFECAGRTYVAVRIDGVVTELAKRERSNHLGVSYRPMNIKGKAAKLVLAAMREAGMA